MNIQLIESTNNIISDLNKISPEERQAMLKVCQDSAKICQTDRSLDKISKDPFNQELISHLIESGHHSIFENFGLKFYLEGIPKILAMALNNEPPYSTTEKSSRAKEPIMGGLEKELYEKWKEILAPEIEKILPKLTFQKKEYNISKKAQGLAMENARYMVGVATPTHMGYKVDLRQLNYLFGFVDEFITQNTSTDDRLKLSLIEPMKEFQNKLSELKIPGLTSRTDRHLSLFANNPVEKYFGESYSTNYEATFAALAQLQRSRTINFSIVNGTWNKSNLYAPEIVKHIGKQEEWIKDMSGVYAEGIIPQGQLITVNEQGTLGNFRSLDLLRVCGQVQKETMDLVRGTGKDYKLYQEAYGDKALLAPCIQGIRCKNPCPWGGRGALERIV